MTYSHLVVVSGIHMFRTANDGTNTKEFEKNCKWKYKKSCLTITDPIDKISEYVYIELSVSRLQCNQLIYELHITLEV